MVSVDALPSPKSHLKLSGEGVEVLVKDTGEPGQAVPENWKELENLATGIILVTVSTQPLLLAAVSETVYAPADA